MEALPKLHDGDEKHGWYKKEARNAQQVRTIGQFRARCAAGWLDGNGAIGRLWWWRYLGVFAGPGALTCTTCVTSSICGPDDVEGRWHQVGGRRRQAGPAEGHQPR